MLNEKMLKGCHDVSRILSLLLSEQSFVALRGCLLVLCLLQVRTVFLRTMHTYVLMLVLVRIYPL